MQTKTTILGVDPGSQLMGYALLEIQNNKPALITMDVLSLTKYDDIYERLEKIHTKICSLISTYQPKMFAIEAPFFGKNVQSMLKLGRAQGVAIAAAMQYKIPVTEYSPKKVKQSITGNGNASKEQVWSMLQHILHIQEVPKYLDASDALSVALCHYYQTHSVLGQTQQKFKNWEHYIQLQEKKVQKK